jgi:hypothetical protein
MIWGNDEKFTKEYQIQCREEQQKRYNEYLERRAIQEKEEEKERQIREAAIRKFEEERRVRGEILNPFIKQNLKAKITAARWALALAMGMTLLFKGFWALWILFILLYNWEVKRFKKEALEADLKRGKKK